MKSYSTIPNLQKALQKFKANGKSIAFAPTMGALHQGHIALINRANEIADISVCSIFVNPTQFNVKEDLDKYPRLLEGDSKKLEEAQCDILFHPDEDEVYPDGTDQGIDFDIGYYGEILEAEFRPGHFEGMVQVVSRLLDIVQPDFLIMGQKDFQQFTIVQKLIDFKKINTKLDIIPIARESDGLAMSSRNIRLDKGIRLKADIIHQTLSYVKRRIEIDNVDDLKMYAEKQLNEGPFRMEYFEIVDGFTLQPIEEYEDHGYVVVVTAVWAGEIRLIDNIICKKAL